MKKNNVTLLLVLIIALFSTSCNKYVSMSSATKVGELRGNPFMYQVSKSVVKNICKFAEKNKISTGKIGLLTSLSSIFSTADQIGGVKDLVSLVYNIPAKKVNNEFAKLSTIKDLISFIAKNGKGFNFYKWNTSL